MAPLWMRFQTSWWNDSGPESGTWKQDVDAATCKDLRGLFLPRCISHLCDRGVAEKNADTIGVLGSPAVLSHFIYHLTTPGSSKVLAPLGPLGS